MTNKAAHGPDRPGRGQNARGNGPGGVPDLEVEIAELSDTGRARPHNEDYLDYFVPEDPHKRAVKGSIYLVADGMGGHQAGEVASRQAVELVIDQYYNDIGHDVGTSLVRAFRAANRMLYDQAQSDPAKSGMGTTLVAAVILGRKVYVANVGDSRAYLITPGGIAQITEDHSWVQEQTRAGLLTPEQARQHPQRNVVTRALGSRPSVEVDLFEGQISENDVLLMCSDGLTGLVEDREVQAIVQGQPAQSAVRSLVAMANERGGSDNISVLIVSARKDASTTAGTAPAAPTLTRKRARRSALIPILAAVLVLLVLLALAFFFVRPLFLSEETPTAPTTPTLATGIPSVTPFPTAVLPSDILVTATTLPVDAVPLGEGTVLPPTVTLIPSQTPTPSSTPEPTRPLGANTQAPTRAAPSAAPKTAHPAPVLLAPEERNAGSLRGRVAFRWSYSQPLKAGEGFQVLIWKQDVVDHLGAAEFTMQLEQLINLDDLLPSRGGSGVYLWSVVVVEIATGKRLSPEAPPWRINYAGPQTSGGSAPPDVPAPTPGGMSSATSEPMPTLAPLPTLPKP